MPDDNNAPVEKTEESLLRELADGSRDRQLIRGDLISFYMSNKRGFSALIYIEEYIEHIKVPKAKKSFLYLHYGICMESIEDYETAILCYSKMFSIDSLLEDQRYLMNNNTGFCLNKLGRYEEAASYCVSALAVNPFRHNAYKNLGLSFQGQGYYRFAAECFIFAIQRCRRDRRALHHLEDLVAAHRDCFIKEDGIEEQLFECRSITYDTVHSQSKQ